MKKNYFNAFLGIFSLCLILSAKAQNCTPPNATINPAGFTVICNTTEGVVLTANAGTGLTYQWKKNGTNIVGATSQTYAAKEAGGYSVTVSSSATCSANSNPTFVQTSQPNNFRVNVTPKNATTCGADSATLRVNPGMGTYQWYTLTGPVDKATLSTFKTPLAGSYYVKVTMQGSCPITSDTATVTLQEVPAKPTISLEADSLVSSVAATYQWFFNNNPIPNANKRKLKPMSPGTYTVRVGSQTCSSTSDAYDFVITANTEASILSGTNVYPSPFNNSVFINSNSTTELSVVFYNNLGMPILETTAKNNSEILVGELPSGVYNVKIQSESKSYFTRLIKQ